MFVPALLFALAAAVWIVPIARSGRSIAIGTIVLLSGTVVGPFFFSIDGPIQFSFDRVLLFALLGLLAIRWRMGEVTLPRWTRSDFVVLAIVVWFFLMAIRPGAPPSGIPPTARWLFCIALPASLYAVARVSRIEWFDWRVLSWSLLGLGIYLAITAVLELRGLHELVFPKYIVDANVWEFFGRGRGPLMNPAGNGMVISLALAVTTINALRGSWRARFVYAVVATVLLAGIYATLTRSVWVGAIGTFAAITWFYCPRWVRVLGVIAALLFGAALAAGLKDAVLQMKRDKALTAEDAAISVKLRPLLAVVAWEMFRDRPLTGHGYGHYFANDDRFHTNRSYGLPLEMARSYAQHNVFLSVLVDCGAVGLCLLLSWLIIAAGTAWRLVRDSTVSPLARHVGLMLMAVLAIYFCNGMFHDVMIIPMVHMFCFFMIGIGVTTRQQALVGDATKPVVIHSPPVGIPN